jgi:hypothetical protein
MAQTVTECLTAATDSVTLITDINSNGSSSDRVAVGVTQAEINEQVQRNVDHVSTILLYTATGSTPEIAGAASNLKTTHVAVVTMGNAYVAVNS